MSDDKKLRDTLNAPHEAAAKAAIAPKPGVLPVPATPDSRWGVEHCCVRQFWAVIERDASLVRGRNVVRTAKLGTGVYEVFFTGEVSNGAFVATIGRPGIATEPPGEITVALRCCQVSVRSSHSMTTRACGYKPSIPRATLLTARST